MKRRRFTGVLIIGILHEQSADTKFADLACKHSEWEATLCNYKAKHCGIDIWRDIRLKGFEDENLKLKKTQQIKCLG